jgi:hypothetical protein
MSMFSKLTTAPEPRDEAADQYERAEKAHETRRDYFRRQREVVDAGREEQARAALAHARWAELNDPAVEGLE